MRRETRDRVILPVLIPLVALIGIIFFVFFFSRILLAVDPIFATLIALGLSLNVLTASALVAAVPHLRTPIIVGALAVGAALLGGVGTLAMAVSPEARLEAGAEGPEAGTEPEGGEQATPGGGETGGATCEPSGTKLQVVAPSGALATGFDTVCLAAPEGTAFTVDFRNDDSVAHDWALYRDESAQEHLGGGTIQEPIDPGEPETYEVKALEPGRYFFRCDFHPTTMTGTFVVE